jgi:opacity protein-like surface antigen
MSLSTFRLCCLVLVASLVAGSAGAAEGYYLKAIAGASFVQDDALDVSDDYTSFDYDYDTGYVLGAAFGVALTPALAVEAEYAYRNARADVRAAVSGLAIADFTDTWHFGETVTAQSAMVNVVYRFEPAPRWPVQPYVGAGIGGAVVDFGGDETDTVFAWQAFAGSAFAIGPRWCLHGAARWFATDDGTIIDEPGYVVSGGFETIELLLGVTWSFP